jgi:hypothetical protein
VVAALVGGGLYWSRRDTGDRRCTVWWRSEIVYHKLAGELPDIGWKHVARAALLPCAQIRKPEHGGKSVTLLRDETFEGHRCELYRTSLVLCLINTLNK